MLSCGRLRNTVNCATSSCLTSLRVLRTAQLTVLCDYVSKACKLSCYTGRNCCFCVLIRPSLTADRSIWLLLLQLQASVARSTVNAVVSILSGEKSICLPSVRPNKLDLLFLISHFLDLGAGGRLLFITSLFYLMSRSHEACLT